MHHIAVSSSSSSFNYPTPVQKAKSRFAPAPANSPPPAPTTSIAQASEGLQRPLAMSSMQAQLLRQLEVSPSDQSRQEGVRHSATASPPTFSSAELDTMLAKAVDAQRLDIITQAGPSNSLHLNALEQLKQRGFKPADSGLEIRFTPYSLLGGSGRNRRVTSVPSEGAIEALQGEVENKKQFINNLIDSLREVDPKDEDEIQRVEQQVDQAEVEFSELASRLKQAKLEFNRFNPGNEYYISSDSDSE